MQLPWSITFILKFLEAEFSGDGRVEEIRLTSQDLGIAFRADARAEGQCVRIGGWECLDGARPASS